MKTVFDRHWLTLEFAEAQMMLKKLTEINDRHTDLSAYQKLIDYGVYALDKQSIQPQQIEKEIDRLARKIQPLARNLLARAGHHYLALAWHRLAAALENQSFEEKRPRLHASYCLMQADDWPSARQSLADEKTLPQSAELIKRMTTCCEKQLDYSEALLWWCILFECNEPLAEKAIDSKISDLIVPLWEQFWDMSDNWPGHFFPAFILASQPGLIHHLDKIPPLTRPETQAMISILTTKLLGKDEMTDRINLQTISPALLDLYMKLCQKTSMVP